MNERILSVVASIITHNNKFLVIRRNSKYFKPVKAWFLIRGKKVEVEQRVPWLEFPGGKIEFGESIEKAAEREVLEEISLKVRAKKILSPIVTYICDDGNMKSHCFVIPVLCAPKNVSSWKFQKNREVVDIQWLRKGEILKSYHDLAINVFFEENF
ncbi:MAG: NUDIX domain-containing protein [Candidatus Diapherotrites archaeon]